MGGRTRHRVQIAALFFSLLVGVTARASPTPDAIKAAKDHYGRGASAYGRGDFGEAVSEFSVAYKLSERADILFDLARAETRQGHEQVAIDYLKRYLALQPDASDAASVSAEIDARTRSLEAAGREKEAAARAHAAEEKAAKAETHEAAAVAAGERNAVRERRGRWGLTLTVAGGVVLATGLLLNAIAGDESNKVSMGAGMPVVFAGSSFAANESAGRAVAPLGVLCDLVGVAALTVGIVLLAGRGSPVAETPHAWLSPSLGGFVAGGTF